MEFDVNTGPRYGTFTTKPTTGNELTTIFTLTANGWEDFEDTDYPLLYGYVYKDSQSNLAVLQVPLDSNEMQTVLPYINQGVVAVTMTCSDSLGTSTTATLNITISALNET